MDDTLFAGLLAGVLAGVFYGAFGGLTWVPMDPVPYNRTYAEFIRDCEGSDLVKLALGLLAALFWPITWAAFLVVGGSWLLGFATTSTFQVSAAVAQRAARALTEWRSAQPEAPARGRLSLAEDRK